MTLQNQAIVDTIISTLRELHQVQVELLGTLEELLRANEEEVTERSDGVAVDYWGNQYTYTSNSGQGNDLPRGGTSGNAEIRYTDDID